MTEKFEESTENKMTSSLIQEVVALDESAKTDESTKIDVQTNTNIVEKTEQLEPIDQVSKVEQWAVTEKEEVVEQSLLNISESVQNTDDPTPEIKRETQNDMTDIVVDAVNVVITDVSDLASTSTCDVYETTPVVQESSSNDVHDVNVSNISNVSDVSDTSNTSEMSGTLVAKDDCPNQNQAVEMFVPEVIVDDKKTEEDIKMVAKKAKQLVGRNGDVSSSESMFIRLITNKMFMSVTGVGLLLMYLVLGQIMSFVRYVSEILVFTVMPLKIALHVFSTDSDLKQNIENTMAETSDIKELKQAYRQSRKIKRIRLDYGGTLLRQTLVVFIIRMLIMMLPLFEVIPFIGLFSNYVYAFLLFLIILIQTPTTVINSMIDVVAHKLNIRQHNLHLTCPLSDKIIVWIKGSIGDSKLASIRTIRDILLKYDERSVLLVEDIERLFDALDNLGISKEYLKSIGLDVNNLEAFVDKIKDKTDILFANGLQLIFDDNTNIQDLMTNAVKKTVTSSITNSVETTVNKFINQ
ncbi:hypothetical protein YASMINEVIRUS_210 [Yasminevirus sp. GU-2018]|uniref:Uncharacterized protein n=1 Tax=Yasminevirus sp. GU-2018 TaxID=2420051 RepID=A0A5K0U7J8_9VIRU|nr:hypothetical protein YASMINEVIRUS_210 [Yasminevirus sp. GU-2018]